MDKKYTFQDLLDIVEKLRGEGGCPWDREQTHESIMNVLKARIKKVKGQG